MTSLKKVNIIIFVFLILHAISLYYFYFNGIIKHEIFPKNTFLFDPGDAFNDWYNAMKPEILKVYLPAIYIVLNFVKKLNIQDSALFFCILTFTFYNFLFLYSNLKNVFIGFRLNLVIFCFLIVTLSYPVLFTIDRGNPEIFVYMLVIGYIVYEQRASSLSGIFLGAAAAIKFFPLTFLLLSLNKRRYKPIFIAGITFVIINIFGFMPVPFAIDKFYQNIIAYLTANAEYIGTYFTNYNLIEGINFNHSIYSLFRFINYTKIFNIDLISIKPTYYVFILFFTLISTFIAYKISNLSTWKVITLSATISCLFPVVSSDYRLLYIILPIPFYIKDNSTNDCFIYSSFTFAYALLLSSKNFVILKYPISINFLINVVCLSYLLFGIIFFEYYSIFCKKYRPLQANIKGNITFTN